MLRVRDWQKWQKAKVFAAGFCVLLAIVCTGGLEATGTEEMPWGQGALFFSGLAFLLVWSFFKHDGQHD